MGEVTLSSQLIELGFSLLLGVIFCVIYDFFRALHKKHIKSFIGVFFTDIFYWIILLFVTFCFFIIVGGGKMRFYFLLGATVGFLICRFTISKLVFKLYIFIFWALEWLLNLIKLPFLLLFRGIDRFFFNVNSYSHKIFRKIFKKRKKPLERETDNSV